MEQLIAEKLAEMIDELIEITTEKSKVEDWMKCREESDIFLFTGEKMKNARQPTDEVLCLKTKMLHDGTDSNSSDSDDEAMKRLREASVSAEFILGGCSEYTRLHGTNRAYCGADDGDRVTGGAQFSSIVCRESQDSRDKHEGDVYDEKSDKRRNRDIKLKRKRQPTVDT